MNPLLLRKLMAWPMLALFALGALTAIRSATSAHDAPVRTSGELSPFLKEFLSAHNVTVVSRPVEWVSATGGHHGVLFRDDTSERLPALLVIEVGPASEFGKRTAHELAGIGYVVLFVKLDPPRAGDGDDEMQRERALNQLSSAVRWLRRRDDVFPDRMGAVGWNAAGRWALETAAAGGLQAAALVDPPLPLPLDANLTTGLRHTSVLVVRASADASLLEGEQFARLKRELAAAGVEHHVLEFDKAKRGFMDRERRTPLDVELADRAWFEIYEYLGEHVEDADIKQLLAARADPGAQPTPRPFSTVADLMQSLNAPLGVRDALAQSLAEAPKSEQDWRQARARAALLADAGKLLLELAPPKGDAAAWRRHAASFRDSASAIAVAADRRDYSASRQALERLKMSCSKCHLEHR